MSSKKLREPDTEDEDEEEEDADFSSTSGDDWDPKKNAVNHQSSSSDSGSDDDDGADDMIKISTTKTNSRYIYFINKKFDVPNLKKCNFRKPAKKPARSVKNARQQRPNVLTKKNVKKATNDDESDSSGDDYLVDPNNIDLNSEFFHATKHPEPAAPAFDCNVGLNLTDSGSDDDDDEFVDPTEEAAAAPTSVSLTKNEQFNENLEKAKQYLSNFRSNNFGRSGADAAADQEVNVSQLLAMGESSVIKPPTAMAKRTKRRHDSAADSDDWEEVEATAANETTAATDGVLITLTGDGPLLKPKADRTQEHLEASLKRKLNRLQKERQLILHKVHVLCLIGHGNHVNRILNDTVLMELALSFMPSKNCYPKDRTDKEYFGQIMKWYKGQMVLKKTPVETERLSIDSLTTQFKSKLANSKKEFIMMFVVLLRAIGIQCRFVINFRPLPIRPAASDLLSVSGSTDSTGKMAGSSSLDIEPIKKASNEPMEKVKAGGSKRLKSEPTSSKSLKSKIEKVQNSSVKILQKPTPPKPSTSAAAAINSPHFKSNATKLNVPQLQSPIARRTRSKSSEKREAAKRKSTSTTMEQLDGGDDSRPKKRPNLARLKQNQPPPPPQRDHTSDDDSDFEKCSPPPKMVKPNVSKQRKSTAATSMVPKRLTLLSGDDSDFKGFSPGQLAKPSTSRGTPSSVSINKKIANRNNVPSSDGSDFFGFSPALKVAASSKKKATKPSSVTKVTVGQLKGTSAKSATDDSDDFEVFSSSKSAKPSSAAVNKLKNDAKRIDRRLLSTDNEATDEKVAPAKRCDFWPEVFAEKEERWITIDLFKGQIDCVDVIRVSVFIYFNYLLYYLLIKNKIG